MTTHMRPTVFAEAFRHVTGRDPTPLLVAEALKDPDIKRKIDEQMMAIEDFREDEGDDDEDDDDGKCISCSCKLDKAAIEAGRDQCFECYLEEQD